MQLVEVPVPMVFGCALELDLVDPSFRGPSLRRIPLRQLIFLAEAKLEAP